MRGDALNERRTNLEETFFRKVHEEQMEKLRQEHRKTTRREALKATTGVTDAKVLDRLVEFDISNETLAAFTLTPLVQVAWADGSMDEKEMKAILSAAEAHGVQKESPARTLLEGWLVTPPDPKLMDAWSDFVRALAGTLTPSEAATLRDSVMNRAEAVANAAGGFLGLKSPISAPERRVLQTMADAFSDGVTPPSP